MTTKPHHQAREHWRPSQAAPRKKPSGSIGVRPPALDPDEGGEGLARAAGEQPQRQARRRTRALPAFDGRPRRAARAPPSQAADRGRSSPPPGGLLASSPHGAGDEHADRHGDRQG